MESLVGVFCLTMPIVCGVVVYCTLRLGNSDRDDQVVPPPESSYRSKAQRAELQ